MSLSRNLSITLICLILGVMLSWQYKSIQNNKKVASSQAGTLYTLQEELLAEKTKNENLRARNQGWRSKYQVYQC